jgi:sugar lactone lactonase YvrE
MIASTIDVELAIDARAELGEGPVWDDRGRCLYFVDILGSRVHRFDPVEGSLRTYAVGQFVGAIALTERGDLVLAVRDGFARLDPETGAVGTIANVDSASPDRRMNDGCCDPAGRFWAGTMALDEQPDAGALYRLDSGGTVKTMVAPVSISNGIDWSADGTRMFFIDSPTQAVDVFDFDVASGAIANRRPFVRIAPALGMPDGLALDADDHVWVALWGGGAVHRYAPDGSLDRTVQLPVAYPTSCAFGGDGLRDLYVTTAAAKLSAAERASEPRAGGVFRCRPGPSGRLPHRFKG